MLCDVKVCSSNHLDHVKKIVFTDHTRAKYWHEYITYMVSKLKVDNAKRKEQLFNLVQLSLDCTEGKADKEESHYIRLHLLKASLEK